MSKKFGYEPIVWLITLALCAFLIAGFMVASRLMHGQWPEWFAL